MSYAVSAALQEAIFDALIADTELDGLVGGAIFDAEPQGSLPSLYVTLGPETVRPRSDGTAGGAIHDFVISVVTEASGFSGAKIVAGRVSDILIDARLPLTRGTLIGCRLRKAKAARDDAGTRRRIDLTFSARVDDN